MQTQAEKCNILKEWNGEFFSDSNIGYRWISWEEEPCLGGKHYEGLCNDHTLKNIFNKDVELKLM